MRHNHFRHALQSRILERTERLFPAFASHRTAAFSLIAIPLIVIAEVAAVTRFVDWYYQGYAMGTVIALALVTGWAIQFMLAYIIDFKLKLVEQLAESLSSRAPIAIDHDERKELLEVRHPQMIATKLPNGKYALTHRLTGETITVNAF